MIEKLHIASEVNDPRGGGGGVDRIPIKLIDRRVAKAHQDKITDGLGESNVLIQKKIHPTKRITG